MCIMVSTLAVARRLKLALVSIAVTKCCARAPRTDVVSRTSIVPREAPHARARSTAAVLTSTTLWPHSRTVG